MPYIFRKGCVNAFLPDDGEEFDIYRSIRSNQGDSEGQPGGRLLLRGLKLAEAMRRTNG
jgi:hypothetical protein